MMRITAVCHELPVQPQDVAVARDQAKLEN